MKNRSKRYAKYIGIALLAAVFGAAGGSVSTIYLSHTRHGNMMLTRMMPKRKIKAPHLKRHQIRYVYYKDFVNRKAWVSQRSHGKFSGSTCEAASLLTGLRLEGVMPHINLYNFTKNYVGFPKGNGRTSPYISYTRNPYRHHGASIYSQPIAMSAQRAGSKAKVIDGTNISTIVNYIKQGHPVYVEAGHQMDPIWHGKVSDHTLILAGVRKDTYGRVQLRYLDPNCNNYRTATGWCSLAKFMIAWQRPAITGERAVVLLGRGPRPQVRKRSIKIKHKKAPAETKWENRLKHKMISKN